MSKITHFVLAAFLMLSITISCRKVYDFIHDHPDAHVSVCHITRIILGELDPARPWDVLQMGVTYNAKGNPLSLAELNPGKTIQTPELYFRYDKYGRLSDYMYTVAGGPGYDSATFPFTHPFIWHKYAYPRPEVVADTMLTYDTGPLNGPSPIAKPGTTVYLYQFNAAGKMIATATTTYLPDQPPPVFQDIAYDARGNRDLSIYTDIRYDSSINPYRTNKVWQLVFQDYSRNCPVYTTSPGTPANPFGLPTRLPFISGSAPVTNFNLYPFNTFIAYYYIEYACSAPKGPIDY
jgi:hypothetical protein